jgi:hypothetical protein
MLEGQVSILSSGLLSGQEALQLIDSLQKSDLYIRDQNSFLLYPEKEIPGFLEKNHISAEKVQGLRLPKILIDHHDSNLLVQDELGDYHFSGIIHNEKDVREALEVLRKQAVFEKIVEEEGMKIVDLFESIFHHTAFTGRSSTFFAYEGLGSVYWHMVSKLLLAVQETILRCSNAAVRGKLLKKYREIRSGLGFNKTPAAFGAFPTDPYSHTPKGQGARQPGMSGVVKEEIITRLVELGLTIKNGCLIFNPLFVDQSELLNNSSEFTYIDINGIEQEIVLEPNTLAYTYCQTPIVLQPAEKSEIRVFYTNGKSETLSGISLDETKSSHIHLRDGKIQQILVRYIPAG